MIFKNFRDNLCLSFSFAISFALIVLLSSALTAQDKVDFVKDIKPIFEKHCVSCHGPEKDESFRIDDREDALAYIEPEAADESDMYLVLVSDDEEELMPPPDEEIPLTEKQIELVKNWIDQGADWPEGVELVDTSAAAIGSVSQDSDTGEAQTDDENENKEDPEVDAAAAAKTQQIFNAIGSLHPAAVHLPIGLLLASGLFALFSLRGNFVMSDCAYYCLWLGTLGAIIACATGWWFSPMEKRGTVVEFVDLFNQDHRVFWHRTGGLIVTAVAFLLALFAAGARNRDPDDGVLWKLGLIVLACGIGWVGHTGGELHYGKDHYEDLNGLYEGIVSPDGPKAENGDDGDSTEDDDPDGDVEDSGKKDEVAVGELNI